MPLDSRALAASWALALRDGVTPDMVEAATLAIEETPGNRREKVVAAAEKLFRKLGPRGGFKAVRAANYAADLCGLYTTYERHLTPYWTTIEAAEEALAGAR